MAHETEREVGIWTDENGEDGITLDFDEFGGGTEKKKKEKRKTFETKAKEKASKTLGLLSIATGIDKSDRTLLVQSAICILGMQIEWKDLTRSYVASGDENGIDVEALEKLEISAKSLAMSAKTLKNAAARLRRGMEWTEELPEETHAS